MNMKIASVLAGNVARSQGEHIVNPHCLGMPFLLYSQVLFMVHWMGKYVNF